MRREANVRPAFPAEAESWKLSFGLILYMSVAAVVYCQNSWIDMFDADLGCLCG